MHSTRGVAGRSSGNGIADPVPGHGPAAWRGSALAYADQTILDALVSGAGSKKDHVHDD